MHKLNPREMVAREIMSDESKPRTMTNEEAAEAIQSMTSYLMKRAEDNLQSSNGLQFSREFEVAARMVAYFGTQLIAFEEIERDSRNEVLKS